MKRCITLISLGLCLAVPMLSQASDIKPSYACYECT